MDIIIRCWVRGPWVRREILSLSSLALRRVASKEANGLRRGSAQFMDYGTGWGSPGQLVGRTVEVQVAGILRRKIPTRVLQKPKHTGARDTEKWRQYCMRRISAV